MITARWCEQILNGWNANVLGLTRFLAHSFVVFRSDDGSSSLAAQHWSGHMDTTFPSPSSIKKVADMVMATSVRMLVPADLYADLQKKAHIICTETSRKYIIDQVSFAYRARPSRFMMMSKVFGSRKSAQHRD